MPVAAAIVGGLVLAGAAYAGYKIYKGATAAMAAEEEKSVIPADAGVP